MTCYKFPIKNINQKTVAACPKRFEDKSLLYALATELCANKAKSPARNIKNINRTVERLSQATGFTRDLEDKKSLQKFLTSIEHNFNLLAAVYRYNKKKNKMRIFATAEAKKEHEDAVYIDILMQEGRFKKIKNFDALVSEYICEKCNMTLNDLRHLKRHNETCDPTAEPELVHDKEGKIFRPAKTLVEEIQALGMKISDTHQFHHFFAAFDIECYCTSENDYNKAEEMPDANTAIETQTCALICVATNMPGFEIESFWNKQTWQDLDNIVYNFVEYLLKVAKLAAEYNYKRHRYLLEDMNEWAKAAIEEGKEGYARKIVNVAKKVQNHLDDFTIFSFNGGGYDLPILSASGLFHYLKKLDGPQLSVMRDKAAMRYLMVKSEKLRFVDLMKLIGPAASLSKCLTNFGIKELSLAQIHKDLSLRKRDIMNSGGKLLFAYSTATSYKALRTHEPFVFEDFYSILSNDNLLSPKHAKFCELLEEGMTEEGACKVLKITKPPEDPHTVLQMINDIMARFDISRARYYQLYCETDTISTLKLAQKLIDEFAKIGICNVFEKLTISSLSYDYMLRQIDTNAYPNFFTLLNKHDFDFVKRAAAGGVSTCFNRLMIRNYTPIRFHEYGNDSHKAKKAMLFDVNSMYLSSIGEASQSLGFPMLRRSDDNFKVSRFGPKEPFELTVLMYLQDIKYPKETIRTNMSLLGQKKLWLEKQKTYTPLDGWIDGLGIAISVQGCYYHACSKCYPPEQWDDKPHPTNKGTFAQVRARSDTIAEAVSDHPDVYEHIIIAECEFHAKKISPDLLSDHNKKLHTALHREYTEDEILRAIQNEEIHGFVELSIKVRESALAAWQQFPPLFCKKKIKVSDLDYNMRRYAIDNRIMREEEEREALVPCLEVEGAVVSTKLLKFYLDNNIITYRDVKTILQFAKADILKKFRDNLVYWRMEAENAGENVKAMLLKLIGNSAFGSSLMNPLLRPKTIVLESSSPSKNKFLCHAAGVKMMRQVGKTKKPHKLIEYSYISKKAYSRSLVQFGAEILQNSKIQLYMFYNNFFVKYFDPRNFETLMMDTDSMGVALAEDKLVDNVRPELRAEFEEKIHEFVVPTKDHPNYAELRVRPYMVKCEMDNCFAFVALAPKSYTGISMDDFVKEGNKGVKSLTCNMSAINFCSKLKCLLTDEEPKREALMPQLKMDKNKQNMQLYVLNKRATSRLCTKFLYCGCGTCFFNRDIAADDLLCVRRYPFILKSCNITYEGACKALHDFMEEKSSERDFSVIKAIMGYKNIENFDMDVSE